MLQTVFLGNVRSYEKTLTDCCGPNSEADTVAGLSDSVYKTGWLTLWTPEFTASTGHPCLCVDQNFVLMFSLVQDILSIRGKKSRTHGTGVGADHPMQQN